jgi:hypothetical protein
LSTTSARVGSSSTTSPTPRVRLPRHVARLVRQLVVDYFASRRLVVDYFAYAARPGASAHRATRHVARRRLLRLAQARRQLLHLRRASGCFGSSCGLSRDSSSTTSPRAGSSSTTSPTPCVRVPRHVAGLITRLVVDYSASQARHRLLRRRRASGSFGTSRGSSRGSSSTTSPPPRVRVPWLVARLVIDYFEYAARSGASARRAARRQLLHLLRASGCFGWSCGLSRDSSSTTSPRAGSSSTTSPTPPVRVPQHVAWLVVDYSALRRLVVDYFDYAARPVASARRAARRLARRRLLRLRRASRCLSTSRSSSRGSSSTTAPRAGSSSTTSPTPRVQVPRHVTRLVVDYSASRRLFVDHFDYAARPVASARRAARRRLLCLRRASGCFDSSRGSLSTTSTTPRVRLLRHVARHVLRHVAPLVVDYFASRRLVVDYFAYAMHPGASARRAARHAARRRLLRLTLAPR